MSTSAQEVMMKKKAVYEKDLPQKMYTFFTTYQEFGTPSFSKFARHIGVTLEDLEKFRKRKEFDRAYRECNEIKRDYLTDMALAKRFDSSLVKFLLGAEFGMGEDEVDDEDKKLEVTLEVVDS